MGQLSVAVTMDNNFLMRKQTTLGGHSWPIKSCPNESGIIEKLTQDHIDIGYI